MEDLIAELEELQCQLKAQIDQFALHEENAASVIKACDKVDKAFSHSPIGYHAKKYLRDFKPRTFEVWDKEWGDDRNSPFPMTETRGDWVTYEVDDVLSHIYENAGIANLNSLHELADKAYEKFKRFKQLIEPVIDIFCSIYPDEALKAKQSELKKTTGRTVASEFFCATTTKFITRDARAASGGTIVPAHMAEKFNAMSSISVKDELIVLFGITQYCIRFVRLKNQFPTKPPPPSTMNFHYEIANSPMAKINTGTDASSNFQTINESEVFLRLREMTETNINDDTLRQLILCSINELEVAKGKSTYVDKYNHFISIAADHLAVYGPMLPILSRWLLS